MKTKKLFIAGLMTSGTTVVLRALKALRFGTSTDPYLEGQQDPLGVRKWKGRFVRRFPSTTRSLIQDWVNSYCKGQWFIEKTPTRFTHFLALQELFPDTSYFLVVQRDPLQVLGARARGRLKRSGVSKRPRKEHKKRYCALLGANDKFAEMWDVKFQNMIQFHRKLRPELTRFSYIRYEELCASPAETISRVLQFLKVSCPRSNVERVCRDLNIRLRHVHPVVSLHPRMRASAKRLARVWSYIAPERWCSCG